MRFTLIGGQWDRLRVAMIDTPERIEIHGTFYERVDDPDTGAVLCYAVVP